MCTKYTIVYVACAQVSVVNTVDTGHEDMIVSLFLPISVSLLNTVNTRYKQEGAAVEGPPAMGSSLQLSKCVLLYVLAVLGLSRLSDGGNGRCHGNEVIRGKAARGPYDTC